MPQSPSSPGQLPVARLAIIAAVVGVAAVAFAYTAGWLSPHRLTPAKLVASLAPPGGPALGHRRNHAKGICFTGTFEANGNGSALSKAQVFVRGQYPVVGRFNLATADPNAADAMVRVRGLGIRIIPPDGQEWRSAMIDAPIFPVSTPQDFYELQMASGSKDPDAMKNFIARASGIPFLRRLGQERALDRELCGGALQQSRLLSVCRRVRRQACDPLVIGSGGATCPHRAG